jgi:hypothetical protein
MSVSSRVAALERVVDSPESGRLEYSYVQLLTAARLRLAGATSADAWAVVGPPQDFVKRGEASAADFIVACRLLHKP